MTGLSRIKRKHPFSGDFAFEESLILRIADLGQPYDDQLALVDLKLHFTI